MGLEWKPKSYEDAQQIVDMANGRHGDLGQALAIYLPQAIALVKRATGEGQLTCPSPSSDATGKYRVVDVWGSLVIQKLDATTGKWDAPAAVATAVETRTQLLAEAEEALGKALVAGGVPDEVRDEIQRAYDIVKELRN